MCVSIRFRPMKFATGVGLAVMMAVIIISQRGLPLGFGWLDAVALGLFFLLLGHLVTTDHDAGSHESAGDGFAFRAGKALKRILNNRRGNTATRD